MAGHMESVENEELKMSGTREGGVLDILSELLSRSSDIEAAAVVSADGNPIATLLPPSVRHDRIGAMFAALYSLGERTVSELGRGELTQIFIEGRQGYVFVLSVGSENILVLMVRKGSKLGVVLSEVRNTVRKMSSILESMTSVK